MLNALPISDLDLRVSGPAAEKSGAEQGSRLCNDALETAELLAEVNQHG